LDKTTYLTIDEVIVLHDEIVERWGSPHSPLIHPDKLDSAINRPRNAAWYEGADLVRQSVILAIGISQSQEFLDGNKRAAFAAFRVFLEINGLFCQGDPLEIAQQLEAVAEATGGAERERKTDEFEAWVRERVTPVNSG
jgi:death on curing protein